MWLAPVEKDVHQSECGGRGSGWWSRGGTVSAVWDTPLLATRVMKAIAMLDVAQQLGSVQSNIPHCSSLLVRL